VLGQSSHRAAESAPRFRDPFRLVAGAILRGLRTASASTAALLSLIEALTAALLAALVLGDRLSATGIVGAVMLLAAVVRTVRTETVASSA
jgi:DME family drug/metabolite transporter